MYDLIVIAGPTASGKTDSSIDAAIEVGGEIVSADSMQVYRRMDIGTAKPAPADMRGVRHHMIDVADPSCDYSVAMWREGALNAIKGIKSRGKIPVVVGGTGLYIRAFLQNDSLACAAADSEIRRKWADYQGRHGNAALRERLLDIDPESAARLHENDSHRIIRALEIYEITGITASEHLRRDSARPPRFRALKLAVDMPRDVLYSRIDRRVDIMMEAGLLEEVRKLLACGVPGSATSMQGIGYKELADCLNGGSDIERAIRLIKQRTRNYAKRQMTWFRGESDMIWLKTADEPSRSEITGFFLGEIKANEYAGG